MKFLLKKEKSSLNYPCYLFLSGVLQVHLDFFFLLLFFWIEMPVNSIQTVQALILYKASPL